MNYYNEFDPFAAEWLRQLIACGLIPDGEVDDRDIRDVHPTDLKSFTQCHFFAGIGGWSRALQLAGWCHDRPVWTGSCPCQPFSAAGRGDGFEDERHLWPAWQHLIEQCTPPIVLGEQVAAKAGRTWLDLVQSDLEALGYATAATDMCAAGIGAPHWRQRLWFVGLADGDSAGPQGYGRSVEINGKEGREVASRHIGEGGVIGRTSPLDGFWGDADWTHCTDGKWRPVEPGTCPLVNGVSGRVGALRGYGNAVVPQVAQAWIETIMECI